MGRFRYQAIDPAGRLRHGEAEAVSESELVRRLQSQGYVLLRADLGDWQTRLLALLNANLGGGERSIGKKRVARLTRELAILLSAGQDMDQALRFLAETAPDAATRTLVADLRDRVRGGRSLASALAAHPRDFSRLYVGLVTAGESGGSLAATLAHLAGMLERDLQLAQTIRSALAYPAMLVAAAVGTIVLLLTWVLPQFTPIFAQAGAQLPTATRLLIDLGAAFRAYGLVLPVILVLGFVGLRLIAAEPRQRRRLDALLLRLPVVGSLIRQAEAARLTRTLGTLLTNGVGLVPALGLCRQVLLNQVAVAAVDHALERAKAGGTLAEALAVGGAFPPHAIHLLKLGSETGQLGGLALRAAEIHEEAVRVVAQRLVALLVPMITIFMGALVAAIIGSLLVAMMSLNDLAL
jgi:general secretion pathway protein F